MSKYTVGEENKLPSNENPQLLKVFSFGLEVGQNIILPFMLGLLPRIQPCVNFYIMDFKDPVRAGTRGTGEAIRAFFSSFFLSFGGGGWGLFFLNNILFNPVSPLPTDPPSTPAPTSSPSSIHSLGNVRRFSYNRSW